ncbi:hypothetical protein VCSRO109_0846 [Vibrio cholerae]|nr:hypothetical protein VCSRO109_0846 [Vibrio cholerae]
MNIFSLVKFTIKKISKFNKLFENKNGFLYLY